VKVSAYVNIMKGIIDVLYAFHLLMRNAYMAIMKLGVLNVKMGFVCILNLDTNVDIVTQKTLTDQYRLVFANIKNDDLVVQLALTIKKAALLFVNIDVDVILVLIVTLKNVAAKASVNI
jgi:hypothetical protein